MRQAGANAQAGSTALLVLLDGGGAGASETIGIVVTEPVGEVGGEDVDVVVGGSVRNGCRGGGGEARAAARGARSVRPGLVTGTKLVPLAVGGVAAAVPALAMLKTGYGLGNNGGGVEAAGLGDACAAEPLAAAGGVASRVSAVSLTDD